MSKTLPPAPNRYKDPRMQEIFSAGWRADKEYMLRGGGAVQCAWRAGYLGLPMGRHGGADRTSISACVYRAGQARRKWEVKQKDTPNAAITGDSPVNGLVGNSGGGQ